MGPLRTELEILTAIARTYGDDGMVSARTITGYLTRATFVGLVSLDRRFVLSRAERLSIAACLRGHGFTEWDIERSENGVIVRHPPHSLIVD